MAFELGIPGGDFPQLSSTSDMSAEANRWLCIYSTSGTNGKIQTTKAAYAWGIMQNNPKAGGEIVVRTMGMSRARVTAGTHTAIAIGDKIICSSGGGVRASTGTTVAHYVLGRAVTTLAANTTGVIVVHLTHQGSGSTGTQNLP